MNKNKKTNKTNKIRKTMNKKKGSKFNFSFWKKLNSKLRAVIVIVVIAAIGTIIVSASHAATAPSVGIAEDATGQGYWLVTNTGVVINKGDAPNYGDLAGKTLNAPIVGITATADRKGYWLVGADGGVFSFGDASFYGSMGGKTLNAPVVGMTATADGKGYWLVGADGGVFSFGDASFYGSMANTVLNMPVSGIASTPTGAGYVLVAQDGGVFTFGNAVFVGSTVTASPTVAATSTSSTSTAPSTSSTTYPANFGDGCGWNATHLNSNGQHDTNPADGTGSCSCTYPASINSAKADPAFPNPPLSNAMVNPNCPTSQPTISTYTVPLGKLTTTTPQAAQNASLPVTSQYSLNGGNTGFCANALCVNAYNNYLANNCSALALNNNASSQMIQTCTNDGNIINNNVDTSITVTCPSYKPTCGNQYINDLQNAINMGMGNPVEILNNLNTLKATAAAQSTGNAISWSNT